MCVWEGGLHAFAPHFKYFFIEKRERLVALKMYRSWQNLNNVRSRQFIDLLISDGHYGFEQCLVVEEIIINVVKLRCRVVTSV